ncbi:2-keto-3-deoxygluconate permease [Clostridium pasteurianum]|uniref:2-keto-3-deoxygluconate permease n=1 Tax=Clostridium pasteurianum BC1 TaxID=86416 RepID=R4K5M0_CLOPA|nr:2-keto-3-deoxygluconate permease [Clostridium pasteurianum]AGK98452.1 2-keto-3-deoxygluconate permease [Clostridium pasteurianum BC1]
MKIMQTMKKLPGGVLLAPAIIGILLNTFFPDALKIGGFTTALFKSSTTAFLALFMLCAGSQIDIKKAKIALAKGAVLTITKILIGACIGLLIGKLFGNSGIFGLSLLAIIPAMTNSNSSLFAVLSSENGDDTDVGAVSVIALNNGPLFTMLILGASGFASIPLMSFVAVLIPVIVGFILGNLDPDWRELLSHGHMLIPFLGFSIGASLNLQTILNAGVPGIILGIATLVFTGLGGYFIYGIFHGKRAVGAAIGTTAGIASATPMALAAIDKTFAPFASTATVQVSASVIITALLCPMLVSYLSKRNQKFQANSAVKITSSETAETILKVQNIEATNKEFEVGTIKNIKN